MCVREFELGRVRTGARTLRVTEGVVRRFLGRGGMGGTREARRWEEVEAEEAWRGGLGVMLRSAEGARMRDEGLRGVRNAFGAVTERSENGGDGGVGVSEMVSDVETDLVSGGVVMSGEEAVETGDEAPKDGELGAVSEVERAGSWRVSERLSLSCMISASILRSPSSSRRRCVSMRSDSRSSSPIFISSSSMTARSIAILNLDSRSSREEEVLRAWRSKSSLATSISRSFSWSVRFESRSVVISFCRVLCTAFASAFDCLYLC